MLKNYVRKIVVYVDYDGILDALKHTPLAGSKSSRNKSMLFGELRQIMQIVEDAGIDLVFRSILTESNLHPYTLARKSVIEHNDRVKVRFSLWYQENILTAFQEECIHKFFETIHDFPTIPKRSYVLSASEIL